MENEYQKENITFSDCKLKREPYANTIINLINNSNELTKNNSLVITLDSPWGTGKSTFVKMLKNKIDGDSINNIHAVLYNAWNNDYCQNPFEPLFYDIINDNVFELEKDYNNAEKLGKTLLTITKAFAIGTVKKAAEKIVDEGTIDTIVQAGEDLKNFITRTLPTFKTLEEERHAITNFKNYLIETSEWLKNNDNRLLIIIDELDRCKPIFAIKTLEIIKHLFDIPNLVFLLAIDFSQLRHSIATIYGQEMDSEGYLRRFTNYILKLPEQSKDDYIEFLLKSNPLSKDDHYVREFIDGLKSILGVIGLSLRDVNCIYENFRIFYKSKFVNDKEQVLSLPYLFLIMLKYKNDELYNEVLRGHIVSMDNKIKGADEAINFLSKIQNGALDKLLNCNEPMLEFLQIDRHNVKIISEETISISNFSHNINTVFGSEEMSKCLLVDDIKRYLEMGDLSLTPNQYIARQIEMFTYKDNAS